MNEMILTAILMNLPAIILFLGASIAIILDKWNLAPFRDVMITTYVMVIGIAGYFLLNS